VVLRYSRILVVIAVLVTLAVLVLAINPIRIGNFERGGDSPLGLKLGLDLQGGSDLRYQAVDPVTGSPYTPREDEMKALKRRIEERVNAGGLGSPNIQILGGDRLLIQLPGVRDLARAKALIGETAQLIYRRRTLDVVRPLTWLSSDDILSVKVSQVPITTGSLPSLADEGATSTAAVDPEPQAELRIPILEIEFTDEAAALFTIVVARLRESLTPVPGTEEVDPVFGPIPGDIYPSTVEISVVGSTSTAIQIPYSLIVRLQGRSVIAPGGDPYITRAEDGRTFTFNLVSTFMDLEEARSVFSGNPELRILEIVGKVDEDIGLTGDDMIRAYPGQNQNSGLPIINIEFNAEGARTFGEITTEMANTTDLLAIFLDDKELIASSVLSPITGGAAFIEGRDFTFDRVRDISLLLESGRLPVPIELIQERDVDAILGADSLAKSVVAGLVGLALVLLFMVLYYRAPGVVAAVSLVIYATLLLAVFKIIGLTLELSGVAAAILSIGMAVDANILIFERMKEELRTGRTLLSAINIGFNRAWPAIRDSNVSTLITCAILFWFADTLGATIVQSFAATLAIGVGMSMFSAITVSRTLLRLIAATPLSRRLGMFIPSGAGDLPQRQPGVQAV
jgi:protein-export membrane protein SecD